MDTSNIILWTISLTLATIGIGFGIVASFNAAKANKQIRDLISDQLIAEEAAKYFFSLSTKVNNKNRTVIRTLRNKKEILYTEYNSLVAETRMAPLPARVQKYLMETEFKDLASHYLDSKVRLDMIFKTIIDNYEILVHQEKIPTATVKKLVKYHEQVAIEQKAIITEYYAITKG